MKGLKWKFKLSSLAICVDPELGNKIFFKKEGAAEQSNVDLKIWI